jgi:hypothetical protein
MKVDRRCMNISKTRVASGKSRVEIDSVLEKQATRPLELNNLILALARRAVGARSKRCVGLLVPW